MGSTRFDNSIWFRLYSVIFGPYMELKDLYDLVQFFSEREPDSFAALFLKAVYEERKSFGVEIQTIANGPQLVKFIFSTIEGAEDSNLGGGDRAVRKCDLYSVEQVASDIREIRRSQVAQFECWKELADSVNADACLSLDELLGPETWLATIVLCLESAEEERNPHYPALNADADWLSDCLDQSWCEFNSSTSVH